MINVSLLRKLLIIITLLIVSLLLGNFVVSVLHSRSYFSDQLSALAEDTATSLGLTLSHAAQEKDIPQIQSMINVIFDRGYYRGIVYRDLEGNVIVERSRDIAIDGVPQWFIDRIAIPERSGSAEVVSGWYRLGEVSVTVHPGYAYRDLWRVFTDQLRIFLFTAVLCYGLAGVGLNYLLRPLRNVEQQAEAICRKEFPVQEELPSTPELRRMVLAMNRMVRKIQEMFRQQVDMTDALRREASLDPVTGLANRREFDDAMRAWLSSEQRGSSGLMVLLHLEDLARINDRWGREFTDQLLKDIGGEFDDAATAYSGAIVSRRGGSDFCAFVPGILVAELEQFMAELKARLDKLGAVAVAEELALVLAGAYAESVESAGKMLSAADNVLREAKTDVTRNAEIFHIEGQAQKIRGAGEWSDYLRQVVDDGKILLHYQPVFAGDGSTIVNHEVLCRVSDTGDNENVINAGVFWPLAERFGLVSRLDKHVMTKALDIMSTKVDASLCVNISPQSLKTPGFVEWVEEIIQQFVAWDGGPIIARLTCELPEKVLQSAGDEFIDFTRRVNVHGVRVGLDHFGLTPSAMASLQSMNLAYVKIDRRFVSGIANSRENQFYVKNLIQIAQSCDVRIIAEGLETQADWQMLKGLGIDGGEGFLLAKPSPELLMS